MQTNFLPCRVDHMQTPAPQLMKPIGGMSISYFSCVIQFQCFVFSNLLVGSGRLHGGGSLVKGGSMANGRLEESLPSGSILLSIFCTSSLHVDISRRVCDEVMIVLRCDACALQVPLP